MEPQRPQPQNYADLAHGRAHGLTHAVLLGARHLAVHWATRRDQGWPGLCPHRAHGLVQVSEVTRALFLFLSYL